MPSSFVALTPVIVRGRIHASMTRTERIETGLDALAAVLWIGITIGLILL